MLAQSEIVGHLLERGLLSAASVVDGTVVVLDASSRNRNDRVEAGPGESCLLKQGLGPEGVATVRHEGEVYRALSAPGTRLGEYLPRVLEHDAEAGRLVLGLLTGYLDLRAYHLRLGRFPVGVAAAAGAALATLHRRTWRERERHPGAASTPWALLLHRPGLGVLRDSSAAALDLIRLVQQTDPFSERLEELGEAWRVQSLTHGDIKWDNVMVAPGARLKLIDWEAARPGDPCWDIGSLLGGYLSFWLFSIPVTGPTPPEGFPRLARYPLERMQPAMRACWSSYVAALGIEPSASDRWLLRATRLAAARLLQTAFEAAQMADELSSAVILHLQLGLNILERPREAAVHLLGIPPR